MSTFRVGDRVMAAYNIDPSGSRTSFPGASVRAGDNGTIVFIPDEINNLFDGTAIHVRWDIARSGMHNNLRDDREIRPPNGYRVEADTLSLVESGKSVRKNSRFNRFVDKVEHAS